MDANYDYFTDPDCIFPFQITVRCTSTGEWKERDMYADRRKGMAEAKDCARYGYLNDWDRVAIHDRKTGNLIKVHKAAKDEADSERFAPKRRTRKSLTLRQMLFGG